MPDSSPSASGRTLTVGYNSSNLITTVTDPLGRRWTYAYTGSDLTSVTDPVGNVTSYTYGAGSTGNPLNANNLLTITDPNAQPGGPDAGDATINVYNAAGQVTSQTDPMGRQTSFAYNVNAATGTGTTTVTDPDGNTTVDAYNQGSLVATSDWSGGTTLVSEEDYVPAQTASGASAGTQLDIATADGNGNVSTTTYDGAGNPVTTTAPDGIGSQDAVTTQQSTSLGQLDCTSTATASSTCQTSGGPTPVTPGGTITPPSSAPPQGESWTLYDTDGNELYSDDRRLPARQQHRVLLPDHLPAIQRQQRHAERKQHQLHQCRAVGQPALCHHRRRRRRHPAEIRLGRRPDPVFRPRRQRRRRACHRDHRLRRRRRANQYRRPRRQPHRSQCRELHHYHRLQRRRADDLGHPRQRRWFHRYPAHDQLRL